MSKAYQNCIIIIFYKTKYYLLLQYSQPKVRLFQIKMNSFVIHVDHTIPGGLDWAARGERVPLSIKHGDCVCVIEQADATVLVLAKGNISENTGRYVKNDERIQLPDGINGRFCKFIELKLDSAVHSVFSSWLMTCKHVLSTTGTHPTATHTDQFQIHFPQMLCWITLS